MSLMRCERHDRVYDSDFREQCVQCENEPFCDGCHEVKQDIEQMPDGQWFCKGCQAIQRDLESIWALISTKM
jgi:hypothetical protein